MSSATIADPTVLYLVPHTETRDQMAMHPSYCRCRKELSLTCYIQLPEHSAGAFFSQAEDWQGIIPPGYEALSEMIDRHTPEMLSGEDARFVFRLFILHHGDRMIDRDEMTPIYSSTTRLDRTDPKRSVVIKRDFDEDFAGCIVNGGCRRCRS
jgi:hypothetical protein